MSRKFETKTIDEATPAELRQYASQFLGIPVDEDTTDAQVLAKVRAANEGSTIFVSASEDEPDQTGPIPPGGHYVPEQSTATSVLSAKGDPKVRLTLHAEERDGVVNNRHKEVGVNGTVWLLKRGEPIEIPYRVFLALELAEREVITHSGDGEVRSQKVKNTPYNIERMPPAEEIAAWHKAVDHLELI